jgi:hypothetical protein
LENDEEEEYHDAKSEDWNEARYTARPDGRDEKEKRAQYGGSKPDVEQA